MLFHAESQDTFPANSFHIITAHKKSVGTLWMAAAEIKLMVWDFFFKPSTNFLDDCALK